MTGLVACCVSAAATAQTTFALPVANGGPRHGVYTIEAWSSDGCANCSVDKADLQGTQDFVTDLLTSKQASAVDTALSVHVVHHGLDDEETTFGKLKAAFAGCKLGSSGQLSPNQTTDLVAFGLRVDCEQGKRLNFVSVVFGPRHVPTAIYWMRDHPIVMMGGSLSPSPSQSSALLQVTVDPDGVGRDCKVLKSSGDSSGEALACRYFSRAGHPIRTDSNGRPIQYERQFGVARSFLLQLEQAQH